MSFVILMTGHEEGNLNFAFNKSAFFNLIIFYKKYAKISAMLMKLGQDKYINQMLESIAHIHEFLQLYNPCKV